jgi:hypothetical protein
LNEHNEDIANTYLSSKYDNLRHLKQAIGDFERLFRALPQEAKGKEALISHLLQLLLAYSFEIKSGNISPADIGSFKDDYYSILFSKEKDETKFSRIAKKYTDLVIHEPLLTENTWIYFFDKGIVDANEIKQELLNSGYFQDEKTPAWMKLWHFYGLDDADFESLLKQVRENLGKYEYKDIGIIRHVAGMLLRFSEIGLYPEERPKILQDFKDYSKKLKDDGQLTITERSFGEDYFSLGYAGKDLPEFKELTTYCMKIIDDIKSESLPGEGIKLLEIMKTDVNKFLNMICLNNSPEQKYYNIPIFKYVTPDSFAQTFLSMNPEDRRTAIIAFEKRYEWPDTNRILSAELDWLNSVRQILEKERNNRHGKLSAHLLKLNIDYIDKFMRKLEAAKSE